jgi:CBS domain containing-hemolysin-like protein
VAVVDEYGGLAGIVTIEDLLAEVVGDFEPEKATEVKKLDEVTYRLHGQLPIRAWRELFTGFLPGQEMDMLAFDTLGGFIVSLLGRMPHQGDSVSVRNLQLTVEVMQHRQIGTVLLKLNDPEVQS